MNTAFLDPSQTKRHEELVYSVSRFVISWAGTIIPTKTLVEKFLGEFTKGKETKVRQAMEEYCNDLLFDKLIISVHDGYLHPTKEQEAFVLEYFRVASQTARSIFYRRSNQMRRVRNDGQFKEVLGRYDKDIFEAYAVALPEEKRSTALPEAPRYEETDDFDPSVLSIPQAGQVGMRL